MSKVTGKLKTITIVGASFGGQAVIDNLLEIDPKLSKVKVVLVDKSGHFEDIAANYEAYLHEKEFAKNSISFDQIVKHYQQPNLSFVQGQLKKVLPDDNKILVAIKDGQVEEVDYDALVISTGQYKSGPWRPQDDKSPSLLQRQREWNLWSSKVKMARSILCVGGGATGVELAAALKEEFPEKKVTLVHSGEKLLSHAEGLHELAMPMLQELGVDVKLQTKHSLGCDLDKQHDLTLNCLGGKTLGPKKYLQGALAAAVEQKTGQIMVNDKFQATNAHPISSLKPRHEQVWNNIFGFGDCALTPLNEGKQIVNILQLAPTVANNAYQVATGGRKLEAMPEPHLIQILAVGKKNGLFVFNGLRVPSPEAYLQKVGLRDNLFGLYNQDPAALEEKKKSDEEFGQMMADAMGDDTTNPMHISNIRTEREKAFAAAKKKFEM